MRAKTAVRTPPQFHGNSGRAALIGLGITAVILVVLIARLDWQEFTASFHALDAWWLLAACGAMAGAIALRALRWRTITGRTAGLRVFWHATILGYVGNIVYPARAGEAMRIVAISRSAGITGGHAIASAFTDRLADLVVAGAFAVFALSAYRLQSHGEEVLWGVLALSALPLVLFVGFLRWEENFKAPLHWLSRPLPDQTRRRVDTWIDQAIEQTAVLRRPALLASVLASTLVCTLLDYVSIWFVMFAMGWKLPFSAAVVVGILAALGTFVPAAPGYVGIYQVAAVLALGGYGTGESPALAFSVVLQAVILGVIALHGVVLFAHYGRRWRELRLGRNRIDVQKDIEESLRQ